MGTLAVVLLDLVMPMMNGLEAAYEIREIAPRTKIVFIGSHYASKQAAIITRRLGVDFALKSEVGKELIPTINCLLNV